MPKTIDTAARREEIAEALWAVARDRGVSAVSVRSVAEEAGVAVGSLRHVFPTRAELIQFSAELMTRRVEERIKAEASRPGDEPAESALRVLRHLLPLTEESRAEMEVNLALFAEAPANPGIRTVRDAAYRDLREVCRLVVRRVRGCTSAAFGDGPGEDEPEARRLHALLDGLALHLLADDGERADAEVLRVLRAEIEALAD
ncbi:TetR/AcrR family transcriptional regulator [Arthrobacter sp. UM1]|uniref:TetR/AcrR family transcriptional regulator n=1 Tax=Arthrobacter sp. UM1 TaxID=2766776 RepID=UPI001CF686EC|nr:TetR family transcriptional regulator C-terminal domain-containing protein [Arthrobacter sp. UM1]MCB4208181.1 TetR family transcriptional regulator C-terminal domain-containing protein [Arthrobacter sp. UM1]